MENARKWLTQPGEILGEGPVIPVIVIPKLEQAVPLARALTAGGIRVLEITLRTPAALSAISAIRREVPEAIVGAGTVTNAAELEAVVKAGAVFAISPGLTAGLLEAANRGPIPLIPGIATVSELMTGLDRGYDHFKFFPAGPAGGVKTLQSFAGPFSQITFCPTGGIGAGELPGIPGPPQRRLRRRLVGRAARSDRAGRVGADHGARPHGRRRRRADEATMILAGDIGGTNTRLALFEPGAKGWKIRFERTFPSRERPSLESTLEEFLSLRPAKITGASFGIAGPVRSGRCEATNLPWVVDAASVAKRLRLRRVGLVNDLVANAHGIVQLGSRDFVTLNRGARNASGNRALISAGTGLGEAGLLWDGRAHIPFASEGGHADFAPRNRFEIELLEYLMARHGRVSYERVLSGPGLANIYQFLRDSGKGQEPPWLAQELAQGDPAPAISRLALEGKSPLAPRRSTSLWPFTAPRPGTSP